MHRLFLEAKLTEKDHQTALQEANARAYEMEAICLDPLAHHLHQLFVTDDDLFFDVYPEEWKQLQKLEFWQLSLMQDFFTQHAVVKAREAFSSERWEKRKKRD